MVRSYFQKLATYNAYMRAHPDISDTAIYNHYEKTTNGMRKTDFFEAIKPLREAAAFDVRNKNSDMHNSTRDKLHTAAYRAARTQTDRGHREYRKGLSEKQKVKYDDVGIHATVKDIEDRTYTNHPDKGVYVEFYPPSEFFAPPVDSEGKK